MGRSPKPGKDNSQTPFSILSCLGKIFGKIIESKLRIHVSNFNIIPKFQFGFQPALSTTHQLHRLTQYIKTNRISRKSTGLVLLDSEKAFDSIWHQGLLHKLIKLNFPIYLIKIIESFLSTRKTFCST